jgi:hypothetical protein
MFKKAKADSRIPAFLQPRTKENMIFQLAAAAVFVVGMILKDEYEDRQFYRRLRGGE